MFTGPAYPVVVAFLAYAALLALVRPLAPGRRTAVVAFVIVDAVGEADDDVLGVEGVNVYRKEDQTVLYTSRWGPSTPRYRSGVDLIARIVQPSGRLRVDRGGQAKRKQSYGELSIHVPDLS